MISFYLVRQLTGNQRRADIALVKILLNVLQVDHTWLVRYKHQLGMGC